MIVNKKKFEWFGEIPEEWNDYETIIGDKLDVRGLKWSKVMKYGKLAILRNPKVITETLEVEVEKEVIKEIPIEKPIYQKVEVPAPYEVVKYVGVPVPKDLSELPEINENSLNGKKVIQGGNAAWVE